MKTARLKMDGMGCGSCAYTIERMGRKQPGVHDLRVYVGTGEIHIQYDGAESAIDAIIAIVRKIGHDATRMPDKEVADADH